MAKRLDMQYLRAISLLLFLQFSIDQVMDNSKNHFHILEYPLTIDPFR